MSASFADLGVPPNVVASLEARGIDAPFPIQAATLPDALAGRDLCGRAPTGSGKTIAFGIPLVVALTEGTSRPKRPRGLVLVPTRELASQVCHELQLLGKPRGPWVEAFYGGVGFDKQVSALKRGVDIAVCCPGRLGDLIQQGIMKLDDVEIVVIDEADRMADMGFLPEVRQLLDQCRPERQTVLFSATLDGDVDVLIKQYQRDPARHELVAEDEGGALAEHLFWQVDRMDRVKTAAAVVTKLGPTIVFCRTKRGADRIATQLETKGVRAAAIHGDRSQKQREKALWQFHKGQVEALVATDVAARGIHVDNVAGVIHFDPPADHKDYVHRSGRTARAGSTGVVVSLVPGELRRAVADIQKQLGYPVGLTSTDLDQLDAHVAEREHAPRPVERPNRDERDRVRRERIAAARAAAGHDPGAASAPPSARFEPSGPARPTPASSRPRADRPAADRPSRGGERPDRRDDGDRSGSRGASRSSAADRPDRPDRPDRSGAARPPARTGGWPVDDDRPPLAEGQRRPSGAARRKAKREAAAREVDLDDGFLADVEAEAEAARRAQALGPRGYLGNSAPPTGRTSRGKAVSPEEKARAKARTKAKAKAKAQAKADAATTGKGKAGKSKGTKAGTSKGPKAKAGAAPAAKARPGSTAKPRSGGATPRSASSGGTRTGSARTGGPGRGATSSRAGRGSSTSNASRAGRG